MSSYATLDDLAAAYEGTVPEAPWVQDRLDRAERLVARAVGGDIEAWATAGKATAEDVRDVVTGMVMRLLRNTSGVQQETAGPFSYSRSNLVSSGYLFLTKEDRKLLGLRRGAQTMKFEDDALRHPIRPVGWDPCGGDHPGWIA